MIRLGFFTSPVMLSCNVPDVGIITDHDHVDFRLSTSGSPLLEERYYALDGMVTVCDLASLIEHYMADSHNVNLAEFTIEAFVGEEEIDHTELTFTVLYCDKDLSFSDPTEFLQHNFLTLTPIRRVAPEHYMQVHWYAVDRESLSFRVYATFLDPEGQRGTYQYVHSGNGLLQHGNEVLTEYVYLPTVAEKIKSARKLASVTLLSVTLRCGERSLTVHVDPALTGLPPFSYVNCFNVVEQLAVQGVTTDKLKVERSLANLGRKSQFYDVSTTKEYEVQTAALTSDECLQIEQMLASPNVRLPVGAFCECTETDFEAMQRILITDFTCELSDSDEKPNTVKFTWRFEQNRPFHDYKFPNGTFDNHFNPIFT